MRELIQRKDGLVAQRATPPYFIQVGSGSHPMYLSGQLCQFYSVASEPAFPPKASCRLFAPPA